MSILYMSNVETNSDSNQFNINSDTRVCLVDAKTRRHIGLISGKLKLLESVDDPTIKPFVLGAIFKFLPRIGETITLPNDKATSVSVVGIVHKLVISKKIPSYILLFVNYT